MDGISSDGTVKRLRWLEAQAEQAYCDMYDAQAGSQLAARYNDAKEFLHEAIGLARQGLAVADKSAIASLRG